MKIRLFAVLLAGVLMLSGCERDDRETAIPAGEPTPSPAVDTPNLAQDEEPSYLTATIVDGAETGALLLAGEDAFDVYTLSAKDLPVWIDGVECDASALQNGMVVELAFNGYIAESFPAQPGPAYSLTVLEEGTGYCTLWLQVLEDLWEVDSGLNGGITQVGVDLSQATGLTEGERSAVVWAFGQTHGLTAVTGTLEELWEEGYFTPATEPADGYNDSLALYWWEDGVHFSIDVEEEAVWSLPDLGPGEEPPLLVAFDAQKWRSGLGAYFFADCVAQRWENGPWTYTVGSEAIS